MPYAILGGSSQTGVVSYQLGKREEFTLLALTALLTGVFGGDASSILLDCRSATGGVIYRQAIDESPNAPTFYSLSPGAEALYLVPGTSDLGPVTQPNADQALYTERLTPVTLTGGCTINMVCTSAGWYPDLDPLDELNPDGAWADLHLWVQPTGGRRDLPANSPPLLTHVAA